MLTAFTVQITNISLLELLVLKLIPDCITVGWYHQAYGGLKIIMNVRKKLRKGTMILYDGLPKTPLFSLDGAMGGYTLVLGDM